MHGIDLFKEKIRQTGIDPLQYFATATGDRFAPKRIRHDVKNNVNISEPRKFAVKYFEANKLFVAWNMKLPNNFRRSVFTLNTIDATNGIMNQDFALVPKYSGERGGETELVAVFTEAGIDDFIKHYQSQVNK